MQPLHVNPLYVSSGTDATTVVTASSPTRAVPLATLKQGKQASQQQQQQQHHQQEELQPPQASSERSGVAAAAAGRCARVRAICRSTPWLLVLSAAFAAGTLVVWALFADRFLAAGQRVLAAAQVQEAAPTSSIAFYAFVAKVSTVASVSAAAAAVLLLGVAFKRQQLAKTRAGSPAGWPHGSCTRAVTQVAAALLAGLLWLITAALVGLLCGTFALWLAAFTGNMAAQQTLVTSSRLDSTTAPPTVVSPAVGAYLAAFNRVKTAYSDAARSAPPSVARSPWWAATSAELLPVLNSLPWANATRLAALPVTGCAASCLDFSLLAKLAAATHRNGGAAAPASCICGTAAVAEMQALFAGMWRDGLTALAALAALAVLATALLVYCLVVFMTTRRDSLEAQRYRSAKQQQHSAAAGQQRDTVLETWMWAGATSDSAVSSFPALDVQCDQHAGRPRSAQRAASPEIKAALSPRSPRTKPQQAAARPQHQQLVQEQPRSDVQADADVAEQLSPRPAGAAAAAEVLLPPAPEAAPSSAQLEHTPQPYRQSHRPPVFAPSSSTPGRSSTSGGAHAAAAAPAVPPTQVMARTAPARRISTGSAASSGGGGSMGGAGGNVGSRRRWQ